MSQSILPVSTWDSRLDVPLISSSWSSEQLHWLSPIWNFTEGKNLVHCISIRCKFNTLQISSKTLRVDEHLSVETKYLTLEIYTSRSMLSRMDWSRNGFHLPKVDNSVFKCNLGFQFSAFILFYPCTSSESKDFSGHCKWAQYHCSLTVTNSLKGDLSYLGNWRILWSFPAIFLLISSLLTRDLGGNFASVTPACRNSCSSCSSCEPSAVSLFLWNRLNFTSCHLYLHSSPMCPFFSCFSPCFIPHSLF